MEKHFISLKIIFHITRPLRSPGTNLLMLPESVLNMGKQDLVANQQTAGLNSLEI